MTRLAGLRNPTTAMLLKAGLKPENVGRIDYSGRRTPEQDSGKISEPQRKRLWAITKESETTEEEIRVWLFEEYKLQSSSDITRGQYEEICSRIKQGEAKRKQQETKA